MVEPLSFVEVEVSADDVDSDTDGVGGGADETVVQENDEGASRRSERVRYRPNYYAEEAVFTAGGIEEPTSYQEAEASPDKLKWEKAMEAEMRSLRRNDVWY